MGIYNLKTFQRLPISVQQAWDFLSDPRNLNEITPPDMEFIITSENLPPKMHQGMIITYKVAPLLGIKMNWVTEITHVKEGEFFVDEQRFGPYAFWHHQHHIRAIEGGVEMEDIIHYKAPLGFLGDIAIPILVKPKLEKIFAFRKQKLEQLFGVL
jgi:ligand-binding SRPBCC domain-containing protein